ncbi:Phosphoribosylglycinamide formyltransferase [Candidatus Thermoflexus japonica]|uniref:Phosphoribosylglycinamide formyltransferase n=1 Tax=Candidatus Thermoflexus japonica TaxID=2035417 RepID=A0A2H5Y7R6_9CHLR|nr:Phosphoribosylglycinamide formyltransferase [Candidatus Thermoflexus japonica]
MLEPRSRLVVMISGFGSNLQAILDACAEGRLWAEVVLVVSNRRNAYGLIRAARAGVPTLYFPLRPYRERGLDRTAYDRDLAERIAPYRPDLVVLAGWMHILSPAFLDRFPSGVINLHPALPGTFPGRDAIRRAFEAYQRGEISYSGCMVHYVTPEVDAGPVLAQAVVPLFPDDTLERFEARMHEAEHRILLEGIQRALERLRSRAP